MGALAVEKYTQASQAIDDATFTVAYPTGQTQASLLGTTGGVLLDAIGRKWLQDEDPGFELTFGASNITVKNTSGVTWPAGEILISFGRTDIDGSYNLPQPRKVLETLDDLEDRVADLEQGS